MLSACGERIYSSTICFQRRRHSQPRKKLWTFLILAISGSSSSSEVSPRSWLAFVVRDTWGKSRHSFCKTKSYKGKRFDNNTRSLLIDSAFIIFIPFPFCNDDLWCVQKVKVCYVKVKMVVTTYWLKVFFLNPFCYSFWIIVIPFIWLSFLSYFWHSFVMIVIPPEYFHSSWI